MVRCRPHQDKQHAQQAGDQKQQKISCPGEFFYDRVIAPRSPDHQSGDQTEEDQAHRGLRSRCRLKLAGQDHDLLHHQGFPIYGGAVDTFFEIVRQEHGFVVGHDPIQPLSQENIYAQF